MFQIVNFQPSKYWLQADERAQSENVTAGLVTVGRWTASGGMELCEDSSISEGNCPVVYNSKYTTSTGETLPPLDHEAATTWSNPPGNVNFLISCVVLESILVLCIAWMLLRYRHRRLLRASQVPVMWMFVLCGVFSVVRVALSALPNSDAVCIAEYWFMHLAFIGVVIMFMKALRIYFIVNVMVMGEKKRTTLTQVKIGIITLTVALVAYLSIVTAVSRPRAVSVRTTSHFLGTSRVDVTCMNPNNVVDYILYSVEGLLLLLTARMCDHIKNVPDNTQEARTLGRGE